MTDINIDGIVTWLSNWFQDKLISGTNIKTINNQSLLGSGNISVGGSGGGLSFDDVYPVGSIYMSVNSTSPQTLFGGTWEQIKDKFLLSSGDTYNNGSTGGSADAVVVSHDHNIYDGYNFVGKLQSNSATNKRVSVPTSGSNYAYVSSTSVFGNFGATKSSGESGTGKNMPPYLVVNVWKRTA